MVIVCGGGELYIVLYLPLYCLTNHAMLPGQMSVTFCIVIVHAYMASEIYITYHNKYRFNHNIHFSYNLLVNYLMLFYNLVFFHPLAHTDCGKLF